MNTSDKDDDRPVYPPKRSGYYRRPRPAPTERYAVLNDEYVVYVGLVNSHLEMLLSSSSWHRISAVHGPHWHVVKAAERKDWEVVKAIRKRGGAVGPRRPRLARLLAKAGSSQQVTHLNGNPLDLRDGNLEVVDVPSSRQLSKARSGRAHAG
jgi:hypothetical protein